MLDESTIAAHTMPLVEHEYVPGIVVGVLEPNSGERRFCGFGALDLESSRAPDAGTLFETGSVGKVFTALLLCEAERRGEFGLDTPITQLFPPGPRVAEDREAPIRAWHLAAHLSGLPRNPDNLHWNQANPYDGYSRELLWSAVETVEPSHPAGREYEYSNFGSGLLGVLLEEHTARSYAELIREWITEPLGLTDTVVEPSPAQRARLASPYAFGHPDREWGWDDALAASGCLRSTCADTLAFLAAHVDSTAAGELEPSLRTMAQVRYEFAEGGGVALGWHVRPDGTRWHNGSTGGYHAYAAYHPEQRWAVALLANDVCPEVSEVGDRLMDQLIGIPTTPITLTPLERLSDDAIERLVGYFAHEPNSVGLTIARAGSRLTARLDGQSSLRVFPENETVLHYRAVEATLRFAPDAHSLTLTQDGSSLEFERTSPRR